MSTLDDLTSILKQHNPDASDDDIKAALLKLSPDSTLSLTKNPMDNVVPAEPSTSFNLPVSDNTVTQNGNQPSMAAPAVSPPAMPSAPAPVVPPVPATTVPPVTTTPSTSAPASQPTDSMANAITSTTSEDNEKRKKALAAISSDQHGKGVIPVGIAAVGDAISNASVPFGGQGGSHTAEKLAEVNRTEADKHKADFELQLKNDPSSDVSKSYRQMVLQLAPNLANEPAFNKMSAQQIGEKLPLIDTMLKAQAAKDSKELGLKQLQANKDISLGLREDQQQGKYEKEGRDVILKQLSNRSGGLGLQDAKVNQAIDLRQMLNQNYDPKTDTYNIPPSMHAELVIGLARLLSGTGQISEKMVENLSTKTSKEGLAKMVTYLTGVPVSGPPQDVIKLFAHAIDRQGETAQELRDKYKSQMKQLLPTQLKDEVKQKLMSQEMGSDFTAYKDPRKTKSGSIQVPSKTGSNSDPMGIL